MSKKKICGVAAVLFAVVAGGIFLHEQNSRLTVRKYRIPDDIGGKLRIVQLSDLHGELFGRQNCELRRRIDSLAPDAVFCTGDMLDDCGKSDSEIFSFFRSLADEYPLFCIVGNHENRRGVADRFVNELSSYGATVLRNEVCETEVSGVRLGILGLDEYSGRHSYNNRSAVPELMEKLMQTDGYHIVLSHYPENYSLIESPYNQYGFDLMLSGHAHGGQWQLPLIGPVISPGEGLFPKYYDGLYDGRLIVSAGLGNNGIPRMFNYPQIVCVDIGRQE
jgi:predicted MPP superfamily phosphohydrolase